MAISRLTRGWIVVAGLSGASAVAMGAWAAHGLAKTLPADKVALVQLASQYQLWHTLALLGVALFGAHYPARGWTRTAALFVIGMLLFSGSLYLLALSPLPGIGWLTPCGGLALMGGWISLAVQGWRGRPLPSALP